MSVTHSSLAQTHINVWFCLEALQREMGQELFTLEFSFFFNYLVSCLCRPCKTSVFRRFLLPSSLCVLDYRTVTRCSASLLRNSSGYESSVRKGNIERGSTDRLVSCRCGVADHRNWQMKCLKDKIYLKAQSHPLCHVDPDRARMLLNVKTFNSSKSRPRARVPKYPRRSTPDVYDHQSSLVATLFPAMRVSRRPQRSSAVCMTTVSLLSFVSRHTEVFGL
ncbi:hypothetical protein EDB92DRAFT_1892869 [Lactarius akahatsu]|uniref:Uncharacterized protein n=1 Tax=Lactarius akahatsu TaxID=416441 RepID=A0AAD4LDH0_9AGAM|nr:hypothetical protein EDB92DRAFT_1892869 [Lactarius akahatsu]